jgi:hypothetical protein
MSDWSFADPSDTFVFTTQPVLDGAPVREVHHDQDGDWQVSAVPRSPRTTPAWCISGTSWSWSRL